MITKLIEQIRNKINRGIKEAGLQIIVDCPPPHLRNKNEVVPNIINIYFENLKTDEKIIIAFFNISIESRSYDGNTIYALIDTVCKNLQNYKPNLVGVSKLKIDKIKNINNTTGKCIYEIDISINIIKNME